MSLSAKVLARVAASLVGAPDIGAASWNLGSDFSFTTSFADGTGANQAQKVVEDSIAVTTSYDLDGTTLPHPSGNGNWAAGFARIVFIGVKAGDANTADVEVSGDFILTKYFLPHGDTLANVTIPVHKAGGIWFFVAPSVTGVAITASTGDGLTVTIAGSDTADVLIIGS